MGDFDFWLGEWDVSDAKGGRGHNSIRRILGDAVIEESFRFVAADGETLNGRSHTVLVPDRGWCQTWVDDQGGYLDFVGGMRAGRMVLERPGQRMQFTEVTEDGLVWDWERDVDNAWELAWRLTYRRTG